MLAVLRHKLGSVAGRLSTALADVTQAGAVIARAPDLIAAGLADPFLDEVNLKTLRASVADGTYLFLTVPSRRWARRERSERLGIPVDITRFRLQDGTVVFARSLTYDQDDLQRLVLGAGFAALAAGSERSDDTWSRPEVCWTLGRAI